MIFYKQPELNILQVFLHGTQYPHTFILSEISKMDLNGDMTYMVCVKHTVRSAHTYERHFDRVDDAHDVFCWWVTLRSEDGHNSALKEFASLFLSNIAGIKKNFIIRVYIIAVFNIAFAVQYTVLSPS